MPIRTNKNFFNSRKLIFVIAYLVTVFFITYMGVFSLGARDRSLDLSNIQYAFSPKEITAAESIHYERTNNIDMIKKAPGDKYLYLKATLPELNSNTLYLRSFNGTARISVENEKIFENISENKLSGSSFMTIPLNKEMSGKNIEIILYSPISNSFDLAITPDSANVYEKSNLPYAFYFILILSFAVLIVSLSLCLLTKKIKPQLPTYLLVLSLLICIVLSAFEYSDWFGAASFLFNLKIFIYLLIPILGILEISLRYKEWNTVFESILSINILYAICVLFLGDNIFFFALLQAGAFLQIANFVFVLNTMTKQKKHINNARCAANIAFWLINVVFWISISLRRVSWQSFSLFAAVACYCLISSVVCYRENRPVKRKDRLSDSFFRPSRKELPVLNGDALDTEKTEEDADGAYDFNGKIPADDSNAPEELGLSVISAFNDLIIKKVYGKDRHSLNVAELSYIIAQAMGMGEDKAREIAKAAALHDIGKLCIPEHILFKNGKLSQEDFLEIKKHNIYGYQLLSSDNDRFFQMAALVAKEHHEHIDGSGYIGLKGNEISIPARIVAVADVFDALVSPRSYKEPWDFDKASEYIKEHRRNYYDEDVVDAFISVKNRIYELYQQFFKS